MKLSNRQRDRDPMLELSMTSMIDVVFLLLIFFLVTTTFVRPERQLLSAIKVTEQEATQQQTELEPAIIEIRSSDDQVVFRIGAIITNDIRRLKEVIDGFENKSDGAFIRVDDAVPFEKAAQVIGICKAAEFDVVSYVPIE